jgi:type I restriction enzyme S subunit
MKGIINFYKETNFQENLTIGKIPKDWEVNQLQNIISLCQNGIWGDDPRENEESYPIIRSTEITHDGKIDLSTVSYRKVSKEKVNLYSLQDGDILVVGSSGSPHLIGRCALFLHPKDNKTYLFSNFMIRIRPKNVNPKFLYYFLNSNFYFNFLKNLQQTSTGLRNLPKKEWLKLNIPLPSLEEQEAIALILSTVDEAIQKTDEIIAKTERLKKGLMQELLTKGIGHKEFRDTEIGRIPKEWEVVKLGDKELVEIIMGQSPPSSTYNREGKGLPFLQGKMEFGDIYPSPIMYCSQPIKIAEPNDILISVRAPVGDVNIAPYKLCIGRGLAAIRFNLNRASHWFYFYYFQKIKNFLENLGKGSTFKAISKEDLENLKVPYPPLCEQQKIAEILSTLDKRLEIERKEKAKLERIKQGLMDLLLTGKVRVRIEGVK